MSLIGPPFGVPGMRSVDAPRVPTLEDQRRLVARARSQARRWMLRAVLLLLTAGLSVREGWVPLGLVLLALAVLAIELARSTTRRAAELADRLQEMERP